MRHIELDASVLELEAAMRALVDAIYQSDTPEHMCVEYNGVMVFAGPDDVVRPSIVERLAWSWRMTRHQSWLFRPRPAVTDLVLEVEAMDGYLLRRLDAPNISDPSIGLRLLVDLAPTLYCPWGGISISEVQQAFLRHQAYDGWRRVPFTPDATERMLVQRAMRLFSEDVISLEQWVRHARRLLKLS